MKRMVASAGLPPLRLEHVGSTAVPGFAAKPILSVAFIAELELIYQAKPFQTWADTLRLSAGSLQLRALHQ